ncbi:Capsular polysaccharide biosynthesis protein [Rhodococcoides kroppenstedtii]|uniref:Capsular polysaccharide biosynthesis protein n=1 Tax=Rhodococcoides kroppenstedtii TaxID=293050 RepID=A0A1I0TN96_9NOCA|nr:Wzz/FepE/Etk N-terminal domain-containing protein [Rhodococcus kroppenstedtii]SFA53241.1 Capsular polysaccharide biosynthesis protein [Rhodococcus kroppenstedtii]
MGLNDYFEIAKRRWMIILACVVAGIVAGAVYTSSLTYSYTAQSRMYVSMATGTSVSDSYQGGMAAQQRITSYVDLVTSDRVMNDVITELSLDTTAAELASRTTATFAPATVIMTVDVSADTPDQARVINDLVVAKFRDLVGELESTQVGAAPAAKVTVIDPATTPSASAGPAPTKNLAAGTMVGLLLGCGLAYLRDRLDKRIRTTGQVAALSTTHFLGGVEASSRTTDTRRVALRLDGVLAEASPRVVVFVGSTAASSRSRQSTASDTVLPVARALAVLGKSTLMVDAATSGRGISSRMRPATMPGVADLAHQRRSASELTRPTQVGDLRVLPLGQVDGDTATFLVSARFATILQELGREHDYVLVDATGTTDGTDALALAAHADHTVVVVEAGTTTVADLEEVLTELTDIGASVAGTILVPHRPASFSPALLRRRGQDAAADTLTPAAAAPAPTPAPATRRPTPRRDEAQNEARPYQDPTEPYDDDHQGHDGRRGYDAGYDEHRGHDDHGQYDDHGQFDDYRGHDGRETYSAAVSPADAVTDRLTVVEHHDAAARDEHVDRDDADTSATEDAPEAEGADSTAESTEPDVASTESSDTESSDTELSDTASTGTGTDESPEVEESAPTRVAPKKTAPSSSALRRMRSRGAGSGRNPSSEDSASESGNGDEDASPFAGARNGRVHRPSSLRRHTD